MDKSREELIANITVTLMIFVIVAVAFCIGNRKANHEDNTDEETQEVVLTKRKPWIEGEAERSLVTVDHRGHLYVVFFGQKTNEILHSPECPCHKEER